MIMIVLGMVIAAPVLIVIVCYGYCCYGVVAIVIGFATMQL